MSEYEDNPLLAEILAEKASAYFGTVRKMQSAIAALAQFDQKQESSKVPDAGLKLRREDLFAEAAEVVWFFIIQREALNLPYYEELFADFDIPDEVRKGMGPNNLASRRRDASIQNHQRMIRHYPHLFTNDSPESSAIPRIPQIPDSKN